MAMVCGPESLQYEVSELAFEQGFAFHNEEFYF
jgi:hypothetical protein